MFRKLFSANLLKGGALLIGAFTIISLLAGPGIAVNPDSFEITCTPVVTYSVTISTPASGMEFTSVDVNQTYVSLTSATVTNNGNVTADWKITGQALDDWMLGAAPAADTVRLLGMLNSAPAAQGEFSAADDVIDTEADMDSTSYAGDQDGNNVAPNADRLLWIRLDSPTDTSYDTTQRFRVLIQAYPSSEF